MQTLNNVNEITVKTYIKSMCSLGLTTCRLQNMIVKSIGDTNIICTIGGTTQQTITKAQALIYINSFGGFS